MKGKKLHQLPHHLHNNDNDKSVVFFPDHPGPAWSTRAFAMIHGAMYDAVAVFTNGFKPLFKPNNLPNIDNVHRESAVDAAVRCQLGS